MFLTCSAVEHREEVSAPWDQLQQQHHGQLVCQQFSAPCVLGLLWAGAQRNSVMCSTSKLYPLYSEGCFLLTYARIFNS